MATHTVRLIFTIIFLAALVSNIAIRDWGAVLLTTLFVAAVGYPFVRKGRVDLYYDDY